MASHEEMRAAVLDLAAKKLQGSTHPVVQSLLAAGGVPGTSSSPVTSQGPVPSGECPTRRREASERGEPCVWVKGVSWRWAWA